MRQRRFSAITLVTALVLGVLGLIGLGGPASAAGGPVYKVMNTNEFPPDGVNFRGTTTWDSRVNVTGFGVYAGEEVSPVCFTYGADDVPRTDGSSNTVWYIAFNVTRPYVGGQLNRGWLNAHFVNDDTGANEVAPGVPACVNGQPPDATAETATTVYGASVYYSPFDGDWVTSLSRDPYAVYQPSVSNETLFAGQWQRPGCDTSQFGNFPDVIDGLPVTTLTGWSAGREGPIGFLRDYPERASNIHHIVLYDPGTLDQLRGDCNSGDTAYVLQNWLNANPLNRLTILAGVTTEDWANRVETGERVYAHQGIQEVYFAQIRGRDTAAQVTVCNFPGMSHLDVWRNFQSMGNEYPYVNECPDAPDGTPGEPWRP